MMAHSTEIPREGGKESNRANSIRHCKASVYITDTMPPLTVHKTTTAEARKQPWAVRSCRRAASRPTMMTATIELRIMAVSNPDSANMWPPFLYEPARVLFAVPWLGIGPARGHAARRIASHYPSESVVKGISPRRWADAGHGGRCDL